MKTILEKLRSIELVQGLIIFIVVFFIALVIFILDVTVIRNFKYETRGVVVAKAYKPSSTSTITTVSSGGKVGVGTVHSDRKLNFIVRYSGTTDEIETNLDTFYLYKEGDSLTVKVYKGKIFGLKSLEIK